RILGRFNVEDIPPTEDEPYKIGVIETVAPDFFATMRIPLLKGRVVNERDTPDSQYVAVINAAMADALWPGEDPIGKRLQSILDEPNGIWRTVVGVVGDTRNNGSQIVQNFRYTFYLPYTQTPLITQVGTSRIVVKTRDDAGAMASAIHEAVWNVDPNTMITNTATMQNRMDTAVQNNTFNTMLLSLLAALGLVLALIGIYGVLSYVVAQRTQEVGLRITLGASKPRILSMMLGRAIKLAAVGIAIGLLITAGFSRYLENQLFEISSFDVSVYIGVLAALLTAVMLAALLPAFRASRVDPAIALRWE
ncbi:MAG: ABC transporter permease, partial [Gammaproteobacteria bacterium]|nr:ABC transporter permease [Gammaproteobacteria bacterium]